MLAGKPNSVSNIAMVLFLLVVTNAMAAVTCSYATSQFWLCVFTVQVGEPVCKTSSRDHYQ